MSKISKTAKIVDAAIARGEVKPSERKQMISNILERLKSDKTKPNLSQQKGSRDHGNEYEVHLNVVGISKWDKSDSSDGYNYDLIYAGHTKDGKNAIYTIDDYKFVFDGNGLDNKTDKDGGAATNEWYKWNNRKQIWEHEDFDDVEKLKEEGIKVNRRPEIQYTINLNKSYINSGSNYWKFSTSHLEFDEWIHERKNDDNDEVTEVTFVKFFKKDGNVVLRNGTQRTIPLGGWWYYRVDQEGRLLADNVFEYSTVDGLAKLNGAYLPVYNQVVIPYSLNTLKQRFDALENKIDMDSLNEEVSGLKQRLDGFESQMMSLPVASKLDELSGMSVKQLSALKSISTEQLSALKSISTEQLSALKSISAEQLSALKSYDAPTPPASTGSGSGSDDAVDAAYGSGSDAAVDAGDATSLSADSASPLSFYYMYDDSVVPVNVEVKGSNETVYSSPAEANAAFLKSLEKDDYLQFYDIYGNEIVVKQRINQKDTKLVKKEKTRSVNNAINFFSKMMGGN